MKRYLAVALSLLAMMTALACTAKHKDDTNTDDNNPGQGSTSGEPGVDGGGSSTSSSSGDPGSSTSSSSSSTSSSGNVPDAGPTQESCLAVCRQQHPTGSALSDAVDACFAKSCNPSCTTGTPNGQTFPPNAKNDAGAVIDCTSPVITFSAACSDCAAANCCPSWNALFGNADGTALNQCSLGCWSLPHAPDAQ